MTFTQRLLFFILALSAPFSTSAQQQEYDSLHLHIGKLQKQDPGLHRDTSLVNAYYQLYGHAYDLGRQQEADSITRLGLDIVLRYLDSKQKKDLENWLLKAQSIGYGNIALRYSDVSDYSKALEYHFKALQLAERVGYDYEIRREYCNIAIAYGGLNDNKKSVEWNLKALKLALEARDEPFEAALYGNIGTDYYALGQIDLALQYASRALTMYTQQRDTIGIGIILGNIGLYNKAIAEDKTEKGEDPAAIPEFITAIVHYKKALALCELTNDLGNKAITMASLGNIYRIMGRFSESEQNLVEALRISRELGDVYEQMEISDRLSLLYAAMAREELSPARKAALLQKAYNALTDYNVHRDSIFSLEKSQDITRKEMAYEYEKKEAVARAISEEEKRINTIIIAAVASGLVLCLVFLFFIFRSLRLTRRQKLEIEEQKHIVEEHRKGIIDSITYAKRIQEALLKKADHSNSLLPDYFVLFKPKDIVSGDFYWSVEKQGHWYICVADCTGHGVPGAFMSMLGIAFLNEINSREELLSPAEILDELREKIVKELKQGGAAGETKDGMDISMLRINLSSRAVEWAGAYNALWICDGNGVLRTVEPDKQPIGYTEKPLSFSNRKIDVAAGEMLYLFSDGYADQFGGPKGKKFKSRHLQELLSSVHQLPTDRQKEKLESAFEQWRGPLEQIDDVTIVGLRF